MFSRPCGRFSGRSQRPGGRRRQDPAKRAPSSQGRPASALRGDPRPGRRPASFGDRPAKSRARIPCFQGLAADFPGDWTGQAGVGARARQSARRHPKGAGPRRYGAIPGAGRRPASFGDRARRNPGRGFNVFKALAAGFPGDRNGQDGHRRHGPGEGARRHPQGRPASASRGDARPGRRPARFGDRPRNPGRGVHVFKALRPVFRAIATAGRASAPGPVKAHAVIPRAPGLGVTGRCPTGATARALR